MTNSINYYEVLEISSKAKDKTIKAAHKVQSNIYHPDKFKGDKAEAHRMTTLINEAKDALLNKSKRAQHDKEIERKARNAFESKNSNTEGKEKLFDSLIKAAEKAKKELERDAKAAELERNKAAAERKQAEALKKEAEKTKQDIKNEYLAERAVKAENLKQAYEAKLKIEQKYRATRATENKKKPTSLLVKCFVVFPALLFSILACAFSILLLVNTKTDTLFEYTAWSVIGYLFYKLMRISYRSLTNKNILQEAV